jgi:threonine dehydrogenase-like Zn-dependent dehydrogenase
MSATGRAVVSGGSGNQYQVREFPIPDPEPGAVVIKISLTNICGSDLHQWRGDAKDAYATVPGYNHGHEATGRVAALGEGVTTDSAGDCLQVGDRVVFGLFHTCGRCRACVQGREWCCPHRRDHYAGLAEAWPHFRGTFGDYHYLFPNHTIYKVPDALPDEIVAGVNCALAQVICALEVAQQGFGEYVLIQGAGGLGMYAIAVARERGAGKIIVIDRIPERLELAALFGADELIDMREFTTPADRVRRVRELTDGWGAEVALEVAGYPAVVDEGTRMMCQGGRYVEIGNIAAGHTYAADPELWVHGNLHIMGNNNYARRHLRDSLDLLVRTRDKYPFHKITSHKFPLVEINEAMRQQDVGHISRASLVP